MAQRVHQGAYAIQHAVQRRRETVEVVARSVPRDAAADVSFNDGLGGSRKGIDPLHKCSADKHSAHRCEGEGEKKAETENTQEIGVQSLQPADVVTDHQPKIG